MNWSLKKAAETGWPRRASVCSRCGLVPSFPSGPKPSWETAMYGMTVQKQEPQAAAEAHGPGTPDTCKTNRKTKFPAALEQQGVLQRRWRGTQKQLDWTQKTRVYTWSFRLHRLGQTGGWSHPREGQHESPGCLAHFQQSPWFFLSLPSYPPPPLTALTKPWAFKDSLSPG